MGSPSTVCPTLGDFVRMANGERSSTCQERMASPTPYTVSEIVEIGRDRFAIELAGFGWVGAGDLSPVVPAGAVVEATELTEDAGFTNQLMADPVATEGDDLADYTLVSVIGDSPDHDNYLHVVVISGALKGKSGYLSGAFQTTSGYDVDSFAAVQSSVRMSPSPSAE